MKRAIEQFLDRWKGDVRRLPLLVRGARQVGKSHTIAAFGRRAFANLVTVNFEQYPHFKRCFQTLNPREIIQNIALLAKSDIRRDTLLFLDEIQACPEAITALRYFHEQLPEIPVIGAGSLLEFAIASEDFRTPVGRIQYLFMTPLSFGEFLDATGNGMARTAIAEAAANGSVNPAVHDHLLTLVKKYFIVGGMPAVVAEYVATGDLRKCLQLQASIAQTFQDDFGKYASRAKHKHLQKIFLAAPKLVGRKFKYSHVDPLTQSRELKEALELLESAGILYRVKRTSGAGIPLEAGANERHFKIVVLDIGLMQNLCGLPGDFVPSNDVSDLHAGAAAEQFVAQELLAHQDPFRAPRLYYWAREARNSGAEVDYLTAFGPSPLPIEVKAGKSGALRSMHLYLQSHPGQMGVRISQHPFDLRPPLLSVPFYAVETLPAIMRA
ncbi:MAG: hypothetical protein A2Z34_04670 [Planctomycetes bacterium RBG_16_59_8]|nr:MAG: hypothetical protein A2Z34_04670 [Planctomycetes bacterium RBG_16_59_8]